MSQVPIQKTLLLAVSAGALSAFASLAVISGAPFGMLFVYVAPLPLMVSGLSLGIPAATVASGGGILMVAIAGGTVAAGIYAVLHAMPSWLLVRQALISRTDENGTRHWFPEGNIIASLSALALAILAGAGFVFLQDQESVLGIQATVSKSLDHGLGILAPALSASERADAVQMLAAYLPGTVGSSWVAMLLINALMAQNILIRMQKNLRPATDLSLLTLPDWTSWALILAAGAALLGGGDVEYIAQNGAMIMAVPFFFLGLGVVHFMAARTTFPGTALVTVYVAMLFSRWALLSVAALGVMEQWVGIRRRFQGPKNGQED